jgi:hypothetical protein
VQTVGAVPMKGQNQIASQTTHWRLTMRTTKKTVAAAALAAGVMMTGAAYAQTASSDIAGPKGLRTSEATLQMRGDRHARAQERGWNRDRHARAQERGWNNGGWHAYNRGWHGRHAGWQHPFGWPGAAAAGAGYAAGSIVGGTLGAAGAVVGAPFDGYESYAYAGDGFAYHGNRRDCLGDYDSAGVRCRY